MNKSLVINEFNEMEVEALYMDLREGLCALPAYNSDDTQNYCFLNYYTRFIYENNT